MKIKWSDSTLENTGSGIYCALSASVKYAYKKLAPYIGQLLWCLKSLTKNLNLALLKSRTLKHKYNITDFCLFRELLRTRNKNVSIMYEKWNFYQKLPKGINFQK